MKHPLIIAELCQNHNGNPELLERMTAAAAASGATHVKIQHIYAEDVVFRPQFENGLERDGKTLCIKRPYQPEVERMAGLELDRKTVDRFIAQCRELGVVPMTTCFSRVRIPEIKDAGFEVVKVASPDLASYPMLRELADSFRELIVSTGGSYPDEIEQAGRILSASGSRFSLLHCVMNYPTVLEDLNLSRLQVLRKLAPVVGFSDHSLVARDGILASKAALALGAQIIERHFTILEPGESKDGPVSITPAHLQALSEFGKLGLEEQSSSLDDEWPGWRSVVMGTDDGSLSQAECLNRSYFRGRFASKRANALLGHDAIFNWEDIPLPGL